MIRKTIRPLFLAATALLAAASSHAAESKPNILVILTDDQGYADVSFNREHPKEVSTPNIDALAKSGVIFTNGYVTGHVCAPSRAALMTGRYQQRATIYSAGEGGSGLPMTEKTFPQFLKPAGYVCGAFGKWHLGDAPEFNPISRGFDEFYGFMGRGAHDYFDLGEGTYGGPMYRGMETIVDKGYLTTRLSEEASAFIKKHKNQPWFAYLAYNAVHSPAQAPQEDIDRFRKEFPNLTEARVTLMALLYNLDQGIGKVIDTLKAEGEWENTLIFFLTDNGGSKAMEAVNTPLRGFKQEDFEGGIRVPFLVSWPAKIKGGREIDTPVIALDILATSMAAAGIPMPESDKPLDGENLLPLLENGTKLADRNLYWSTGSGGWRTIRSCDWKLVGFEDKLYLFDLSKDPGEKNDLSKQMPDKVAELLKLHDAWLDELPNPMKLASKRWDPSQPDLKERKKQRKKEKKKNAEAGYSD